MRKLLLNVSLFTLVSTVSYAQVFNIQELYKNPNNYRSSSDIQNQKEELKGKFKYKPYPIENLGNVTERNANLSSQNKPIKPILKETTKLELPEKGNLKKFSVIENLFNQRIKSENETITQFGYDFFTGSPNLYLSAPVDKSYVLGPGDELFLYVIGNPPGVDLAPVVKLVVDREGKIYIPKLGVFYVWGKTLGEVEKIISNSVGANIKLTVGRLRTFPVYVSGDVKRPGAVVVTGLNTVIDAIMMAGGIEKDGTLRDVVLTRRTPKGIKRIHIDFYRLLLEGEPIDMRLKDGDVIFVHSIGKVAGIVGKVKRPAIYELKGNETISDLIKMAGGLLPSSYKYKVILQRFENNHLLKVYEGSLDDKRFMNKKLKDGDLVFIKQIVDIPENAVSVEGYTTYPGFYEYKPGEKLSQILKPDMFFPDSNMRFGLIERRYPLGSLPKYLTFSPEDVLKGKEDLELKPRDRIVLYKFGKKEMIDFNKVKDAFLVEGEIKYPGIYAYKKGMKLSDILNRDMLTLNTNLYYAEVERRDLKTLEITGIKKFAPIDILEGKKDLTIKRLDVIKFYPKYIYPPIRVSGLVKESYYLPYHKGLKLSEALSSAKFTEDIRNLKVTIFRQVEERHFEKQEEVSGTEGKLEDKAWQFEENSAVNNPFEPVKGIESMAYDQEIEPNKFLENKINQEEISENEEKNAMESTKSSIPKTQLYAASVFLYDLLVKQDPKVDIPLKPGDRLVIQKVKPRELVEKVTVSGYVKNPGIYRISEKTTLYDVLKAAGGFRKNAYPYGIIILRKSVEEMQKKRLLKAISLMKQELEKEEAGVMQAELSPQEVRARQSAFEAKRRLLKEMEKAQVTGRISGIVVPYNLEKLKNSPYNILLEDGDRIYIPKVPGSVLVFGEVYNPSALVYKKGFTVRDYIDLAGGFTKDADKENVFVIKADGSVVSSRNLGEKTFDWNSSENKIELGSNNVLDYKLKPGDAIIVPTEVHVPVMWRPLIKDVMQIIYQGAITVYTITKL